MVTEETPAFTQLTLVADGEDLGTINLAVTITPNGDEDHSSEADDAHDDGIEVTGGCNAGGNGSWAAMFLPFLAVFRRRRR